MTTQKELAKVAGYIYAIREGIVRRSRRQYPCTSNNDRTCFRRRRHAPVNMCDNCAKRWATCKGLSVAIDRIEGAQTAAHMWGIR